MRYFEGDVATHGLHMLFTSDSDNADMTTAVDEIDAQDDQVVLPPDEPNVGAAYSAQFTVPLVTSVTPFGLSSVTLPQPYVSGSGMPSTAVSGPAGTGSSNPRDTDSVTPSAVGDLSDSPPGTALLEGAARSRRAD